LFLLVDETLCLSVIDPPAAFRPVLYDIVKPLLHAGHDAIEDVFIPNPELF
jgi:hypothetical protein